MLISPCCRRWDDLDSFLGKYDAPSTTDAPSSALMSTLTNIGTPAASARPLALPALEEDRFQLSVGKLLLCLQKRDRGAFDEVLDKARAQVSLPVLYVQF